MSRPGPLVKVWRVVIAALAFTLTVLFAIYATQPDVRPLARRNPETTAFIDLRAREAASRGKPRKLTQRWVPLGRISPNLTRAVLVTEDAAFYSHHGIDLEEFRKSMEVNLDRLSFARGGSTITQQLAKNLYLSPSKDPLRKYRELLIARSLEAALTKQRIFELYLNVIEWGDRIYGADAAARAYFGVAAGGLSIEQSALLAGAIANPRVMRPEAPSRRLRARQRMILRRMNYGVRPTDPRSLAEEEATLSAPVEDTPDEREDKPEPEPIPPLPQAPPPAPPTTPQAPPQKPPAAEESAPPRPQPFPVPETKPASQPQQRQKN
jgi:monofunctional biosynthetic peptidoglycan transglycosylase